MALIIELHTDHYIEPYRYKKPEVFHTPPDNAYTPKNLYITGFIMWATSCLLYANFLDFKF